MEDTNERFVSERRAEIVLAGQSTPHALRRPLKRLACANLCHTAATGPLFEGVGVKPVSEMRGHATIALTLDTCNHAIPASTRRRRCSDGCGNHGQIFGLGCQAGGRMEMGVSG